MKIKRQKHVKRVLTFYKTNFGLESPYHVLVDGTFCKAALQSQVNILDQVPKYLTSEVHHYTTKCVLEECRALGPLLYGPLKVLEQFHVKDCGHPGPIPAAKCLVKVIKKTKPNQYFIATQDPELTQQVRDLPGVPLLYISHQAIVLESASATCRQQAEDNLADKMSISSSERKTLDALKQAEFGEPPARVRRKRKGPKGPNPLSCKRKKRNDTTVEKDSRAKSRRRKRHRSGLSEHKQKHSDVTSNSQTGFS